jgi:ribosomal protein S18 acetylase RimI-like enzyme
MSLSSSTVPAASDPRKTVSCFGGTCAVSRAMLPAVTALRPATAADEPFLREMLATAAAWRDAQPPAEPPAAVLHYLEGFGRAGDVGVVAEVDGVPLGAAWVRRFDPAHPGFGFVGPDVPELSIAVRAGHRDAGIGSRLLAAVLDAVDAERVSLSVEPDNPARRLYERAGFVPVVRARDAWTMVRLRP